ncbi:hypothetical protein [Chondromyces apiculatus]|nr:hypothetical protein [Chondromyces apiculatus]
MPYRVTDVKDLARGLRDTLLEGAPGFLEALYDVGSIEDDKLRPLVAAMMADSARFLQMAREKLRPRSVEVASEEQRGTSYVVRLLLDGKTTLEVLVDDVYAREGSLHTRDVMQIKLIAG